MVHAALLLAKIEPRLVAILLRDTCTLQSPQNIMDPFVKEFKSAITGQNNKRVVE